MQNHLKWHSGLRVLVSLAATSLVPCLSAATLPTVLETAALRFQIAPDTGAYQITDKRAGVTWRSHPGEPRFGSATIAANKVTLGQCDVTRSGNSLKAVFHPLTNQPQAVLLVTVSLPGNDTLEFAWSADAGLAVQSVRLLDEALWVTAADGGSVVVPVREGLLIPADSGLAFEHDFDTFSYEGCHMAMLGLVKAGGAALVTWRDPYTLAKVRSTLADGRGNANRQTLAPSLVLSHSARSFRVQFLGHGDFVTIGQAYRRVAKEEGWLVSWSQKLAGHPERAKLFGAVNYKLWSALDRQMNRDSTREERATVNWTFDEAAQVAEHLQRDLHLDKVLFLMGGWIHRGYDNQHPDILPAAPECGGDAALADCARRVRNLGYLFGLHDNYQDIYRDSPSWNEDLIMKHPNGTLVAGGQWAGGQAYVTCSLKALELARRPQNLTAVRRLTGADAYFIDTTYAAGLQECFDPKHPLTRADDMHWKQGLSDYARGVFGIFGSECGREWAIPHSDFFEGYTGVSGNYYANANLPREVGGAVVPLFEVVYRDCIAAYGKYGYDPAQAAEYVLHHIAIGRPLNYHSIPPHLYWKSVPAEPTKLGVRPRPPELDQFGPRQALLSVQWDVDKAPREDWEVFVHFTDERGNILFQADHTPATPTSEWHMRRMQSQLVVLTVPPEIKTNCDIRVGFFRKSNLRRALLAGEDDGERSYRVGRLIVNGDLLDLEPAAGPGALPRDPGVFVRADHGWAEGLHPLDRFVKNTCEILSPLNELTARTTLTEHAFLTPDRHTQRSVFGAGADAVQVIVNGGRADLFGRSRFGGDVVLPPFGFLIEGPTFVAFHATAWNGQHFRGPVLFTLRSLDGRPIDRSRRVRVFHGFGEGTLKVGNVTVASTKETVITPGR